MLVDLPQVNYKGEVAGPICLKMLRAAPKEGVTVALDSNVLTYVRLAILARGAVGTKSRQHPSKEGVPGKVRWLEVAREEGKVAWVPGGPHAGVP